MQTLMVKNWNRIIRFVSGDGRILLGEPKDEGLDVGLAMVNGQTVEVYVLAGEHIWDINVVRTGEETSVKKVGILRLSPEQYMLRRSAAEPHISKRMRIRTRYRC